METRQIKCRYGLIEVFATDQVIGPSLQLYGEWAQAEINLMSEFLEQGSVVVDAGAFIGTHTLAFSFYIGGSGKVYSFELHPESYELLKRNIEANGCHNVTVINQGLSDDRGHANVKLFGSKGKYNFGTTSLLTEPYVGVDRCVQVELNTIDALNLEFCDLVKIDVEGAEVRVLKGAVETIRRSRPVVYAECNSLEHGWAVCLFMKESGYSLLLHNEYAFNAENFNGSRENVFGACREAALVLVPEEKMSFFKSRYAYFDKLIPISTIDDLALGMLKKPQYKNEVLAQTKAAQVLGVNFFATEIELAKMGKRINEQQQEINELRRCLEASKIKQGSEDYKIGSPISRPASSE